MRKRTVFRWLVALNVLTAVVLSSAGASAAGPRVRVIHASPDAPSVDVWADAKPAFTNAPFKGITPYATLTAGAHQFQVVPAGQTTPAVISANLSLAADKDYSIVAAGKLANIAPLVLEDNNAAPAQGKAHVRFVHASPDAPAVDIAVKGGPIIFNNIAFKGVGSYTPVDAGTYDLEVRLAGKPDVVLPLPGIKLENGGVYTAWAMGLAAGDPKLSAVLSVDRTSAAAPSTLPVTGANDFNLMAMAALIGLSLIVLGFAAVRRPATQSVRK